MVTTAFSKQEAREEMWKISASLRAVSELMIPEPDLHSVGRDGLATLLGYLNERLAKLMDLTQ